MNTATMSHVDRWMSVEELRRLIGPQASPCVSLALSLEGGAANDQHSRFDGLVRQARTKVGEQIPSKEVESFLEPLATWARKADWATSHASIAVFHSRDFTASYRLPVKLEDGLFVGERFHVRPLLEFLHSNQRYYMLVLNQRHVSFLKGGMGGLVPVELTGLPGSLDETRRYEVDNQRFVTTHSGSRGGSAVHHGHGRDDTGEQGEELLHFFREIDRRLASELRDDHAPIVLAAPPKQFSLYASVSRLPQLLTDGLHANVAEVSGKELHARAWPIVQGFVREREDRALEHFQAGFSRGRSSDELSFVARAAFQGRVRELFLARGAAPEWGRVDPASGALDLSAKRRNDHDDDVLDDVAEAVLLRGGEVLSLERERMPSKSQIAATLRW